VNIAGAGTIEVPPAAQVARMETAVLDRDSVYAGAELGQLATYTAITTRLDGAC